jgi:hypothetical protein
MNLFKSYYCTLVWNFKKKIINNSEKFHLFILNKQLHSSLIFSFIYYCCYCKKQNSILHLLIELL